MTRDSQSEQSPSHPFAMAPFGLPSSLHGHLRWQSLCRAGRYCTVSQRPQYRIEYGRKSSLSTDDRAGRMPGGMRGACPAAELYPSKDTSLCKVRRVRRPYRFLRLTTGEYKINVYFAYLVYRYVGLICGTSVSPHQALASGTGRKKSNVLLLPPTPSKHRARRRGKQSQQWLHLLDTWSTFVSCPSCQHCETSSPAAAAVKLSI